MDIKQNISLLKYNTFGADIKAKLFVEIKTEEELTNIYSEGLLKSEKILVLGGGSNILFTQDYNGLIIKNNILGIEKIDEDDFNVWVKFGGGENWHEAVLNCISNDWQGIENLSLIPGTVGAAPIQNIGAYGVELKDVFQSLEAFMIETGEIKKYNYEDCEFGYRNSVFKNSLKGKVIITSVILKLNKKTNFNISYGAIKQELVGKVITTKEISDAVIKIRQSKLPNPGEIGNCGSFFKNPVITLSHFNKIKNEFSNIPNYPIDDEMIKIPAGWLIEMCGWKGKKMGKVGTFHKQALVIINLGKANGREAKKLSQEIRQSVEDKFGIYLEAEVNII